MKVNCFYFTDLPHTVVLIWVIFSLSHDNYLYLPMPWRRTAGRNSNGSCFSAAMFFTCKWLICIHIETFNGKVKLITCYSKCGTYTEQNRIRVRNRMKSFVEQNKNKNKLMPNSPTEQNFFSPSKLLFGLLKIQLMWIAR